MYHIKRRGTAAVLREEWKQTKDGAKVLLLKYPMLEELGLVKHCFSTRIGGVSEGIFSTMNFSFTRGDDPKAVETNFERLAEVLEVDRENFVLSDQTHTTNIRKVTVKDAGKGLYKERDYRDMDGLITNEPGLVLSTFYADCVPLYFVDPVQKAIGMSHSGWRGTVARMGARTVEAMGQEYGCHPKDIICAIGPSICKECYEVSEDVAEEFRLAFPGKERTLLEKGNKEGKYQLDLWKANEMVLLEAGIKPEHLAVTDICTCCNHELLFSHRASHGQRGNLGAFLCLK